MTGFGVSNNRSLVIYYQRVRQSVNRSHDFEDYMM